LILNNLGRAKSVLYNEFISGIKTIFITDSVDFWNSNYNNAVANLKKNYTVSLFLQRLSAAVNNLLIFLIISLGAVGLYYSTNGHILPYIGIFGTLLLALYRTLPALNGCQAQYGSIIQQLPAIEVVYNFLQEKSDLNTNRNDVSKRSFLFQNSITFKNVFFRYNDTQKFTINNLSFKIKKNTKTAIVGNSGAGENHACQFVSTFVSANLWRNPRR